MNQFKEHKNITFLKDLPRCEPIMIDSSALNEYKTCPRKYFYRMVLGFADRESPPYFAFGSALHLCVELWFKNIDLPVDARNKLAFKAAMDYHNKNISPLMIQPGAKYDFLSLQRLILSCKLLIDFFVEEQKLGKVEVIASEQIINTVLPDGNTIGGRSDQIVRWNGRLVGRDFKTTSQKLKYFERSLEPNDQFSRYTYIQGKNHGEVVLGQFVLVIANNKTDIGDGSNKPNPGPYLKQFLTTRSAWQLEMWEKEQIEYHKSLERCRETDVWPMNEKSCYRCPFRKTCCSASEEGIKSSLQTEFIRKPWDFTSIGEED